MSWKGTRYYWVFGPIDLHGFSHALDGWKHPPIYWTLGIGRHEWFIWPLWKAEQRWHDHVLPGAPSRYEYDQRRSA